MLSLCLPLDLVQVYTRFSNHDLEVCNTSTVTYVFRVGHQSLISADSELVGMGPVGSEHLVVIS